MIEFNSIRAGRAITTNILFMKFCFDYFFFLEDAASSEVQRPDSAAARISRGWSGCGIMEDDHGGVMINNLWRRFFSTASFNRSEYYLQSRGVVTFLRK